MNLLFTICGRGGSKGVKHKNIRSFMGRPLYQYTLAAVKQFDQQYSQSLDRIYYIVSTDSEEFLTLLEAEQDSKLLIRRRPDELAQDNSPKMPVIADACQYSEKLMELSFDWIIDLDITSPIRTAVDIQAALIRKQEQPNMDVVFSVVPARRNPYFNMVQSAKEGGVEKILPGKLTARQEAPAVYDMNASIYVYEKSFLLSGASSPLDGRCDIITMQDTGVIDIDSEEDFELMELLARYFMKKDPAIREVFEV